MPATAVSMKASIVHDEPQPQMPCTKLPSSSPPPCVWTTSGWNWMPQSGRSRWRTAANGEWSLDASSVKPSGRRSTRSPWLIQTVRALGSGEPGEERIAPLLELELRAAVLAIVGLLDHAAELLAQQLEPVADAEHRHAEVEQLAVRDTARRRRARSTARPRGSMPRGCQRAHALDRHVAGMDLAVDVALAEAARDQLRELGAEVQDQDPVAVHTVLHRRRILPSVEAVVRSFLGDDHVVHVALA